MMVAELRSELYQQLWQRATVGKLPHAMLFSGSKTAPKFAVAEYFSKSLLCSSVSLQGESCGVCQSCHLFEAKSHPNMLYIAPEKEGHAIKIDQIREVNEFVQQTSLKKGYRIVVIHSADDMNVPAANALLKTLEEPASGAMFILINHQRGRIQPTILSRCQRIVFPEPERALLLESFSTEEQSVREILFKALSQLNDPLQAAMLLHQYSPLILMDFMLSWVADVVRIQVGGGMSGLYNVDYVDSLISLKDKTSIHKNLTLMDYIKKIRSHLFSGINYNKQLIIEDMLIRWRGCHECF